jgi:hypothetical protein
LGRAVRYSILAFLAARYGRRAMEIISQSEHPLLVAVIVIGAVAIGGAVYYFVRREPKKKRKK